MMRILSSDTGSLHHVDDTQHETSIQEYALKRMPAEAVILEKTRTNARFVSHGAPDIILGSDPAVTAWKTFFPQPPSFRAIVIISAHWMEENLVWSGADWPKTIHDFGGFPERLYRVNYPARGAPDLARELTDALLEKGQDTSIDSGRGLDHGVWVPLSAMVPDASVPVLPLSLSRKMGAREMFRLGQDLYNVMGDDLYFLASGGVTHNLYEARVSEHQASWALEFDEWTVETVLSGQWDDLIQYRTKAPHGVKNHPTEEHFLPLLAFAGWASRAMKQQPGTSLRALSREICYTTISMTGFQFQDPSSTRKHRLPKTLSPVPGVFR